MCRPVVISDGLVTLSVGVSSTASIDNKDNWTGNKLHNLKW